MVLMNLQDIGQTGIKVAQRERRATAVQVRLEPSRVINPVDAWLVTVSLTVPRLHVTAVILNIME